MPPALPWTYWPLDSRSRAPLPPFRLITPNAEAPGGRGPGPQYTVQDLPDVNFNTAILLSFPLGLN